MTVESDLFLECTVEKIFFLNPEICLLCSTWLYLFD